MACPYDVICTASVDMSGLQTGLQGVVDSLEGGLNLGRHAHGAPDNGESSERDEEGVLDTGSPFVVFADVIAERADQV